MSVGRICTRDVDTADPDEPVGTVARRLAARGVGSLVVVDGEQCPIGIVSDRDLALRVLAQDRDPATTTVQDVMSPDPATVAEATTIESALEKMRKGRLRRLPVVDACGRLVGIVSLDDVLSLIAEELTTIGGLVAGEAPHQHRRS